LPADRASPAPPAIADFACQISLGEEYGPGIHTWLHPVSSAHRLFALRAFATGAVLGGTNVYKWVAADHSLLSRDPSGDKAAGHLYVPRLRRRAAASAALLGPD